MLPDLLDQIPEGEDIGTVAGDGAFDTRRCHAAILARGGTGAQHSFGPGAVMPPL
ncbi:transposase IS4 family protein [Citreicella sp. SE45]|nr:transposase IS4 family protein [Citreicella sp. SE45]